MHQVRAHEFRLVCLQAHVFLLAWKRVCVFAWMRTCEHASACVHACVWLALRTLLAMVFPLMSMSPPNTTMRNDH